MSGKLLMFAKLSLKSFIYLLTEILSFPDEDVKKIYDKYMIEQTICYHIVTDKDSISLQFEIISDPSSNIPETRVRDVIFEVIVRTKELILFNHFGTILMLENLKDQKNLVFKKKKI